MRQLIHNCMIFDGTGSASVPGAVLIDDLIVGVNF